MKKLLCLIFLCSFVITTSSAQETHNAAKVQQPEEQLSTKGAASGIVPAVTQSTQSNPVNATPPAEVNNTNTPEGWPVYVNTGDPQADRAEYNRKKDEWIRNNPAAYKKMNNVGGVQKISRADFEKLPQARKDYLLSHPEQFIIVEN